MGNYQPNLPNIAPTGGGPASRGRRRGRKQREGAGRHTNSLAAHGAVQPMVSGRRAAVLAWIQEHGPATDRQVMHGLGFTDMNAVRPRITELLDMGLLRECGRVVDAKTGMKVRQVEVQDEGH